jgi:phospholipid/cholesterol/gamma-HCH transport system substrate-binding protein
MSARFSAREIWVGLIVLVALGGLIGLVGLASDGPGFLAPQRTIDVVFRDAQGLRVGSPVRVAGLDTGTVIDLDVVESKVDSTLRAKVRISLPANLVKKLRQDVKVTVSPALTGMSHVNIVSSGHSDVPLVAGQTITGVETSLFDPIIEQVGLGPAERNDIKHMIANARQTFDSIAPRVRQALASLEETSGNLKEMSESIRPAIESTIGQVEELARRIRANTPRIESTIARVDEITGQVHGIVGENRENVRQTMASVRDLTAGVTDVVSKDRLKVERLLDGLDAMRARSERVLYQADQIAGEIGGILVRGRTEIERSVTNVRDATDWANRLVQKIYGNPFMLSPFYKPNKEDLRIEGTYDTALAFSKGASDLHDAAKTLEALAARPADPQQQQQIEQLRQRVLMLTNQINQTSQQLSDSLTKANGGRDRIRR